MVRICDLYVETIVQFKTQQYKGTDSFSPIHRNYIIHLFTYNRLIHQSIYISGFVYRSNNYLVSSFISRAPYIEASIPQF